jgi:hypothetical protein
MSRIKGKNVRLGKNRLPFLLCSAEQSYSGVEQSSGTDDLIVIDFLEGNLGLDAAEAGAEA